MNAPTPVVSQELKALLRRVKLGRALDTLPERLALAHSRGLAHAEFLELVLADEVTRRDTTSALLRARSAGLDPTMCLEAWDATSEVTCDHQVLDELASLRFIDAARSRCAALLHGTLDVLDQYTNPHSDPRGADAAGRYGEGDRLVLPVTNPAAAVRLVTCNRS